jgi:hypothetical protein
VFAPDANSGRTCTGTAQKDDHAPQGEHRVTPLERRCRWLLRAYPAWYRHKRAGEMQDALLQASPPGRIWPSVRGARALITGGLRG